MPEGTAERYGTAVPNVKLQAPEKPCRSITYRDYLESRNITTTYGKSVRITTQPASYTHALHVL